MPHETPPGHSSDGVHRQEHQSPSLGACLRQLSTKTVSLSMISRSTFRLANPAKWLWGGWEGHSSVLAVYIFSQDCALVEPLWRTLWGKKTFKLLNSQLSSVGYSCLTSISKGKTAANQGGVNMSMCMKPCSQELIFRVSLGAHRLMNELRDQGKMKCVCVCKHTHV